MQNRHQRQCCFEEIFIFCGTHYQIRNCFQALSYQFHNVQDTRNGFQISYVDTHANNRSGSHTQQYYFFECDMLACSYHIPALKKVIQTTKGGGSLYGILKSHVFTPNICRTHIFKKQQQSLQITKYQPISFVAFGFFCSNKIL